MRQKLKIILVGIVLILGVESVFIPIRTVQGFALRQTPENKGATIIRLWGSTIKNFSSFRRIREGYISIEDITNVLVNFLKIKKEDAINIACIIVSKVDVEFQRDFISQLTKYPQFYNFLYKKYSNLQNFMNEMLFILTKLHGFKKALEFHGESILDKKFVLDVGCGKMEYLAALDYVFEPDVVLGIDILEDRSKFARTLAKILAEQNPNRQYKVAHTDIVDIDNFISGLKANIILMLYPTFFGYGIENPSLSEYFENINRVLSDKGFIIFGIPANEKVRYESYITDFKTGSKEYIEYEIPIFYISNNRVGSYYFLVFDKGGIEYISQVHKN